MRKRLAKRISPPELNSALHASGAIHALARCLSCLATAAILATEVPAQMIGLPVLQNAFTGPGVAAGINAGAGGGDETYALAGSWGPRGGRVQLVAGGGVFVPSEGESAATVGLRAAVPISTPWTGRPTSRFGLAPFAGAGGMRTMGTNVLQFPIGVAVGWRAGLGARRALSIYAAPAYSWIRVSAVDEENDFSDASSLFRIGLGVDLTLTDRLGFTAGFETGSVADGEAPGPRGGIFGFGAAYAF